MQEQLIQVQTVPHPTSSAKPSGSHRDNAGWGAEGEWLAVGGQPQRPWGEDRAPLPVTGIPGTSRLPRESVFSPEAHGGHPKQRPRFLGPKPLPDGEGKGSSAPPEEG